MTITKPSRFSGDPKIYLDENGADLRFDGGQPVMDAGLENAVTISLFTRDGWWGNDLFAQESEQLGSDFEITAAQPITSTSFVDTESAAETAVQWMVDSGISLRNTATATNPSSRNTAVNLLIEPPANSSLELQVLKNGTNWINQKLDPASEK